MINLSKIGAKITDFKLHIISVGVVAFLMALSVWLMLVFSLTPGEVKQTIISYGSLGPLIYIGSYILTVVFSPLTGVPFVIAGLAIFGYFRTFLYTYISNLTGASISFLLARNFGRPIVARFVGKKNLRKVDEITEMIGKQTLIIFRLAGGGSFDFVSYAAGFTCMRFPIYFLITASCLIPGSLIAYYLFGRVMKLQLISSAMAIILLCIQLILVPVLVYQYQKREAQKKGRDKCF